LQLDTHFLLSQASPKKLKKHNTRTRLYEAQVATSKTGLDVRVNMEVRAPLELVVAYTAGYTKQFALHTKGEKKVQVVGERRNNHSVILRARTPLPPPFEDREMVVRNLWEKMDDDTYFVSQESVEHQQFPRLPNVIRLFTRRSYKLTRLGSKLTKLEMIASTTAGGSIPKSVVGFMATGYVSRSQVSLVR
jgi:hypothetical protein